MQKKGKKYAFYLGYLVHASILIQNPREQRGCICIFIGSFAREIVKFLLAV